MHLLRIELGPLEDVEGVVRWENPDASVGGTRYGEGLFPHLYFEPHDDNKGKDNGRRLWLRRDEVESVREVVSSIGSVNWEEGLKSLEGWLV